ncbi:kinesin-related protein 4 isoform X2 [Orussus abietinus]|uniref:kinesin-related protein 4 isoform X2 n=1 Tax=Orussus abietinus TaxID=222816 RepID=UPI000625FAF4|nr:kinesin-related protein 4 isoform X2 [Orussus abietinus]
MEVDNFHSTSGQSKEVSVSELNTKAQDRSAVQKSKSEKNETRSQKLHDDDDSDSDMNLESLFRDIPAKEWNRKFTESSPTVENESEAEYDLILKDKEKATAKEMTQNGSKSSNSLSFKTSEVKAKKGYETKTGGEEANEEMDVESDMNEVNKESVVRKSLQSNQQLPGLVVDNNVKKSDSFRKSVDNSESNVLSTTHCKSIGKSESTINAQKDVHSSADESSKSSLETLTFSKGRLQKKIKSIKSSLEKNINVNSDLNNLNTCKVSNKLKILEPEEDNANFDDEEAVAMKTNVSFEKSDESRISAENQQVSRRSLNKSNQEHGSSFIAVTKNNESFNEMNFSNSLDEIPSSPILRNKKSPKKRKESMKEEAHFSMTSTQGEVEPEHLDTHEDEEEGELWKNSSVNTVIHRSESGGSGKSSKRASLVVEEDESLFVSGKQIKTVPQKYVECSTVNQNYSITAQVSSESSNDNLEDSTEQWIPQFLYDSSNGEEDDSSNDSINSDIAREYNLDGKSDVEDSGKDIPGDICRESEVENSDSDDNGSDLEGFVVDDEEEDEEEEDQSVEKNANGGKGKKKFSRIAMQFSDEGEEESDSEVNPKMIKTSVGDKSKILKFTEKLSDNIETLKTPKRGKVSKKLSETDKSQGFSDEQSSDTSPKTPRVSSTPKASGKTWKNKIVSNVNLGINKDESSNCSTSDGESLSPEFIKKKNQILNQLYMMASMKSASFRETRGTKQKVSGALRKSLPAVSTDLTDVTETNLLRQKSSKVSMLNKTNLTANSKTPVTKFPKKQRLYDTLSSADLQEKQAEGILDEAKEIVESSKKAHLTSKTSTLDESPKEHIHTQIKKKSNEKDTKILVEQEEMTPTENTTELKNSKVNKKASKKLKYEEETSFEAQEAVDKPTEGEKKKKKQSDQSQEIENPGKSKTKHNLEAQEKLEATVEAENVIETIVIKKQKKKKRPSAEMIPSEDTEIMDDKPAKKIAEKLKKTENVDEGSTQRPSKKRKKVESTGFEVTLEEELNPKNIEVDSGYRQKLKKSKKSPAEQGEQETIKMADENTNKESAGKARKKKKKERVDIINPEDQPTKISKLTSKESAATSDSDEAPEVVDFSKARAEALRTIKNAVDSIKAGKEAKRKERREQLERIHQKKSAKLQAESAKRECESRPRNLGLKRLPDEVIENLSDSSIKRPKKRRKHSKTDEIVPSKSLFVPDRASNPANSAENGFIPLSAAGSTTEFSAVKLKKIKKQTSPAVASFREHKLARNNRQPSTSYTTYHQKLKASGKDKLPC